MSEKRLDNAEEKLDCKKKYLYEYSMFWECNEGSKCQILEDDVVDLLNEQQLKIRLLEKENIELKKYKKYCAEWMGVKEENLSLRCVKMSEKRFKLSDWCGEQSVSNVIDIEKQTHLTNIEVLDLLNKQHSIICRDEISIKTMMSNMKKLEEENKELNLVNEKLGKMLDANYKAALELESEVCLLNAFLVEQGLAEKYIRWKGED